MPAVVIENISFWPHDGIDIVVDRNVHGRVARRQTSEFIVEPGRHSFQAKADGEHSIPVELDLTSREMAAFACKSSGIFKRKVDLYLLYHHLPHDRFDEPSLMEKLELERDKNGRKRTHPGEWSPPW